MKNVRFQPLGDRILVQVAAATSKVGLLEIPNAVQETPNYGLVLETATSTPYIQPGDVVLYNKYGGFTIYLGEKPMVALRPSDLICKVSGKDEEADAILRTFIETGDKSLFDTPKNPMVGDGTLFSMNPEVTNEE